jgi:hypothetical protein
MFCFQREIETEGRGELINIFYIYMSSDLGCKSKILWLTKCDGKFLEGCLL